MLSPEDEAALIAQNAELEQIRREEQARQFAQDPTRAIFERQNKPGAIALPVEALSPEDTAALISKNADIALPAPVVSRMSSSDAGPVEPVGASAVDADVVPVKPARPVPQAVMVSDAKPAMPLRRGAPAPLNITPEDVMDLRRRDTQARAIRQLGVQYDPAAFAALPPAEVERLAQMDKARTDRVNEEAAVQRNLNALPPGPMRLAAMQMGNEILAPTRTEAMIEKQRLANEGMLSREMLGFAEIDGRAEVAMLRGLGRGGGGALFSPAQIAAQSRRQEVLAGQIQLAENAVATKKPGTLEHAQANARLRELYEEMDQIRRNIMTPMGGGPVVTDASPEDAEQRILKAAEMLSRRSQ